MNLPFCYVRAEAKSHGRKNQIEGEIFPKSKVVVVEDLISTGGSSIEVVKVLRAAGCEVLGVVAIFDYGFEKAKNNFAAIMCPYKTISNYEILIQEAISSGYVTPSEHDTLKEWNKDPENWFSKS
jgi:orotate phosphoribosyltransferase